MKMQVRPHTRIQMSKIVSNAKAASYAFGNAFQYHEIYLRKTDALLIIKTFPIISNVSAIEYYCSKLILIIS